jgi:hypothetical protein
VSYIGYMICILRFLLAIPLKARSNSTLESSYMDGTSFCIVKRYLCSQYLPYNSTLESSYTGRAFTGI